MFNLNDKVVYITGGSKGVGYGIAKILAACGMRIAISGRNENTIKKAANLIGNDSSKTLAIQSDVSKMNDEINAIDKIIKTFGRLDVLVANAGVGHFAPIDQLSSELWQETIDTNLTGVFNSVKASMAELKKSKGYIITIASLASTNFFENGAAYNASKFGLVGFTQAIMLDLRKHGIKVTTIMPGSVATNFNDHEVSDADAWKIQPEDIGQIVKDLLNMNERTLPSKVEVRPTFPSK